MLKIKGVITLLKLEKDDYDNDYLTGVIDCPRSSGTIDTIYFRTEYDQMKYLHFKDSMNTNSTIVLTGSLRTYPTGTEFPRYRTVLYVRDYSVIDLTEGDLNIFEGWLEVLKVGEVRQTPNGTNIIDLTVFSKRQSGMKDKISMVAFDNTAWFCSRAVKPGMTIKVVGRFQSRNYNKAVSDTEAITVTTNELVASYITIPGGEISE